MKNRILIALLITLCAVIILMAVITLVAGSVQLLQAQCVEFSDPALGSTYYVQDSFVSEGVTITALRYLWSNGVWYYDGYALVDDDGMACYAGQDIWTNNINLAFDFGGPVTTLTLFFGEYGGNLNVEVNGSLEHFENFIDIHGLSIGGALASVSNGGGQGCGTLTLSGVITSFFVGGQELFIDHICYEEAVEDSCVDFEDVPLAASYSVGDAFLSEGASVTIREFQYGGGTWTGTGETDVSTDGLACHSGREMRVNNCNLEVNFGHAVDGLSLYCGDLGGNDNLRINGDFANVPDITDLHGLTLGGVDISVANAPGQACWIVTLTGVVHLFSIGGQEFFLDHICPGEAVDDECIDFEDVSLIDTYYTGMFFTSEGYTIDLQDFQWATLQWTNNGYAAAGTDGMACHLGHEMWTNNINMAFTFGPAWPGLALSFGEYGGNLNIEVNGDFRNIGNFNDIAGQTIGGATVSVTGGSGQGCGVLLLDGTIQTFVIGGQELWIDHICPEEVIEDSCVDFEDLSPTDIFYVNDVFSSEGATFIVEQFQWSSGTWTVEGNAHIGSGGLACDAGQEVWIGNVNLDVHFGSVIDGLSLLFGEYGGNLNIDINGDFHNIHNMIDIDGATIGGVDVFVTGGLGNDCGELLLQGVIYSFSIGGQEFVIDHICPGEAVDDDCVDFEDLTVLTTYTVGNIFVSEGTTVSVEQFQWGGGTWTSSGIAQVHNAGLGCHMGQDMNTNNVNLRFDFGTSWPALSLSFGEYGGNLNIDINGDFKNISGFAAIHGTVIGGVPVIVTPVAGSSCGTLLLAGEITSFAIGGQELWIDHICPEEFPGTGACCLDDGSCVGTSAGVCNLLGGISYQGDGSTCLGDADRNGTDDACETGDCVRGDVNCDMSIDVLDVLAVINDILGEIPLTDPAARARADCNGDAAVNVLDALGIVNVILGLGTCVPGGCKSTVTPETMEFIESFRSCLPEETFNRFVALIKTEIGIPSEYKLEQNYPNPFNPTTDIGYQLPDIGSPLSTSVSLGIYNSLGQEIRTLVEGVQAPGYHTVTWDGTMSDGRQAGSGIYFYRLTVGDFSSTRRMILMK